MKKVKQLIKAFRNSGLTDTENIELDNLDRAKLVYNEANEVVVENEHGTQFDVSDLSNSEIDVFLYILSKPIDVGIDMPNDLIIDMAITLNLFCEMYNCNDEILEQNGIDWWYMHKLNRRVQFRLNKK